MQNGWFEQTGASLGRIGGSLLRRQRPDQDGGKDGMSRPGPHVARPPAADP